MLVVFKPRTMKAKKSYLRALGVYGFEKVEQLILASLISEDPILLIGRAGTYQIE